MKKKSTVAGVVVMVLLILLALPLGVHTSFTRLREEVRGNYYYDDGDYSLYDSIDAREAASSNLITVAEKYTAEDPELSLPAPGSCWASGAR